MITAYLDRDKPTRLKLLVNGATVKASTVTRATLWIPPNAMENRTAFVADTDGSGLSLDTDNTVVVVDLGDQAMKPGVYQTELTVYDAAHPNGIPWDTPTLEVKYWNAT